MNGFVNLVVLFLVLSTVKFSYTFWKISLSDVNVVILFVLDMYVLLVLLFVLVMIVLCIFGFVNFLLLSCCMCVIMRSGGGNGSRSGTVCLTMNFVVDFFIFNFFVLGVYSCWYSMGKYGLV